VHTPVVLLSRAGELSGFLKQRTRKLVSSSLSTIVMIRLAGTTEACLIGFVSATYAYSVAWGTCCSAPPPSRWYSVGVGADAGEGGGGEAQPPAALVDALWWVRKVAIMAVLGALVVLTRLCRLYTCIMASPMSTHDWILRTVGPEAGV
jgi:hypothetical protein